MASMAARVAVSSLARADSSGPSSARRSSMARKRCSSPGLCPLPAGAADEEAVLAALRLH